MGLKLAKYYQYICDEKPKIDARFELAARTKIPSVFAESKPDSPRLIEQFKIAVEQITGKPAPCF